MKRALLISLLFVFVSGFGYKSEIKAQRFEYNHFYVSLAPHGSWIEIDNGLLAWKPFHVGFNWSPYQAGRWVWSSYGWYWDSFEAFGDITYHYGRWYNDDYYGWLWIPDNEWGPAWVEWRYDDDYIGWAPLSPYATFSIGFGIRFTRHYDSPWRNWNFVRYHNFCDDNMYRNYIPSNYKHRIFSDTKYRNDYGYEGSRIINRGVDRSTIERRANVKIREREVVRMDNPRTDIRRNTDRIEVYSPNRDVLKRGDVSNIKIERSSRTLGLDVSKVDIGRREDRNTTRETVKRTETTRTETPQRNDVQKPRVEEKRTTIIDRKSITPERQNIVPERRTETPSRQTVTPESRNTNREERPREVQKRENSERKQEVRNERSRQQETGRSTETRQREVRSDSPDRRNR